MHTKLDFFIHQ